MSSDITPKLTIPCPIGDSEKGSSVESGEG